MIKNVSADRTVQKPIDEAPKVDIKNVKLDTPPSYKLGEQVATRLAYGTALAKVFHLRGSFYYFLSTIFYINNLYSLLVGKKQSSRHWSRR